MSYFVRIETERGEREIWGVDLERALTRSKMQAKISAMIGAQRLGSEPVTMPNDPPRLPEDTWPAS